MQAWRQWSISSQLFFEPGRQTAVVAIVAEVVSDDVLIATGEIHSETLRMVVVFPFPRLGLPFAVIGILRFPVSIFLFLLSSFRFVPGSIFRLAVPIRLSTSRIRFLVRISARFGNRFQPGIRIRAICGLRRWRGRRRGSGARHSKIQCSLRAQNNFPLSRCDSGQSSGTGTGCRANRGVLAAAGDVAEDRAGSRTTEDQAGVAARVGLAVNLLRFGDDRRIADLRELKSDRCRPLEPPRAGPPRRLCP